MDNIGMKKCKKEDMKLTWKPRPIISEELTGQPALEKSFIGVLKDKKGISKAIASLIKCLPCPQHLKRCSGLRIYLAPTHKMNDDPEIMKQFLVQESFDLTLLEDELEIMEVPSQAPKTKSQMAYASKFWPVNFHPDLNLEALISGTMFDDAQLASLDSCMKLAIAAAVETQAIGSEECNGSAVIIDPEDGKILAIATSSVDKHPMWHAAMLAVDLVARIQGGGAWKLIEESNDHESKTVKRKHQDDLPLRYPESLKKLTIPDDNDLVFAKKDVKNKGKNVDAEKCGPYLCTGYWAILLQEPCPLCSMALLHSRVSRIFYGSANLKTGILGSRAILHSVPGLNHRYQVWSGVLEDECDQTLKKCRVIDR